MSEQDRVKKAQAIKQLKDMMAEELPAMIEQYALTARLHKLKYDAMIKEGFTPAQALELCKTV